MKFKANEKLKPCPFCGGRAEICYDEYITIPLYGVICTACRAKVPDFNYFMKESDAVESWNHCATIIRCKYCRYYQDNNGGYPHENCKWNKDETPDPDDYCSGGERIET